MIWSDTFLVGQDPDNAANSSDCMHLLMPGQQMPTRALCRSFKASVDVFHKYIQLISVQSIDSFLHLGRFHWEQHQHDHIQCCILCVNFWLLKKFILNVPGKGTLTIWLRDEMGAFLSTVFRASMFFPVK